MIPQESLSRPSLNATLDEQLNATYSGPPVLKGIGDRIATSVKKFKDAVSKRHPRACRRDAKAS